MVNSLYILRRVTPALVTLGFVAAINAMSPTPIEWTYPQCLFDNGVQYPVQGFPFPYIRQMEAFSGSEIMPHIHLLNLLIISILIYPFVKWALHKIELVQYKWLRWLSFSIIAGTGFVFLLTLFLFWGALYYPGFVHPVCPYCNQKMFRHEIRYLDLRPVWYNFKSNQCTPSRWWYPSFQ